MSFLKQAIAKAATQNEVPADLTTMRVISADLIPKSKDGRPLLLLDIVMVAACGANGGKTDGLWYEQGARNAKAQAALFALGSSLEEIDQRGPDILVGREAIVTTRTKQVNGRTLRVVDILSPVFLEDPIDPADQID